jgi:hypothetical protein
MLCLGTGSRCEARSLFNRGKAVFNICLAARRTLKNILIALTLGVMDVLINSKGGVCNRKKSINVKNIFTHYLNDMFNLHLRHILFRQGRELFSIFLGY